MEDPLVVRRGLMYIVASYLGAGGSCMYLVVAGRYCGRVEGATGLHRRVTATVGPEGERLCH